MNKKFYDGMPIQRADGFVVQTGQPKGPAEGFVDPRTKRVRRIPLEVRVTGDRDPYYEATLEVCQQFRFGVVVAGNEGLGAQRLGNYGLGETVLGKS